MSQIFLMAWCRQTCIHLSYPEMEISSFWQNSYYWLHQKLLFWQLWVQPLTKMLLLFPFRCNRYSVCAVFTALLLFSISAHYLTDGGCFCSYEKQINHSGITPSCDLEQKRSMLKCKHFCVLVLFQGDSLNIESQIARFMGPSWGPPGTCWPQMGPMLAPWTLLSGFCYFPCYEVDLIIMPPASTKLKGGYTGITLSVCPSVRLWTESFPLCIFNNTHGIHFIFAHLIKQLQKVCQV